MQAVSKYSEIFRKVAKGVRTVSSALLPQSRIDPSSPLALLKKEIEKIENREDIVNLSNLFSEVVDTDSKINLLIHTLKAQINVPEMTVSKIMEENVPISLKFTTFLESLLTLTDVTIAHFSAAIDLFEWKMTHDDETIQRKGPQSINQLKFMIQNYNGDDVLANLSRWTSCVFESRKSVGKLVFCLDMMEEFTPKQLNQFVKVPKKTKPYIAFLFEDLISSIGRSNFTKILFSAIKEYERNHSEIVSLKEMLQGVEGIDRFKRVAESMFPDSSNRDRNLYINPIVRLPNFLEAFFCTKDRMILFCTFLELFVPVPSSVENDFFDSNEMCEADRSKFEIEVLLELRINPKHLVSVLGLLNDLETNACPTTLLETQSFSLEDIRERLNSLEESTDLRVLSGPLAKFIASSDRLNMFFQCLEYQFKIPYLTRCMIWKTHWPMERKIDIFLHILQSEFKLERYHLLQALDYFQWKVDPDVQSIKTSGPRDIKDLKYLLMDTCILFDYDSVVDWMSEIFKTGESAEKLMRSLFLHGNLSLIQLNLSVEDSRDVSTYFDNLFSSIKMHSSFIKKLLESIEFYEENHDYVTTTRVLLQSDSGADLMVSILGKISGIAKLNQFESLWACFLDTPQKIEKFCSCLHRIFPMDYKLLKSIACSNDMPFKINKLVTYLAESRMTKKQVVEALGLFKDSADYKSIQRIIETPLRHCILEELLKPEREIRMDVLCELFKGYLETYPNFYRFCECLHTKLRIPLSTLTVLTDPLFFRKDYTFVKGIGFLIQRMKQVNGFKLKLLIEVMNMFESDVTVPNIQDIYNDEKKRDERERFFSGAGAYAFFSDPFDFFGQKTRFNSRSSDPFADLYGEIPSHHKKKFFHFHYQSEPEPPPFKETSFPMEPIPNFEGKTRVECAKVIEEEARRLVKKYPKGSVEENKHIVSILTSMVQACPTQFEKGAICNRILLKLHPDKEASSDRLAEIAIKLYKFFGK